MVFVTSTDDDPSTPLIVEETILLDKAHTRAVAQVNKNSDT